ncbi:MAG: hypothetical protein IJI23_07195 [Lachnospiraceae bacterium]|nr:hypothetical protein [Lachnospiraceae bacterium]
MNKNKYFITLNVFTGEDNDQPEVNVVPENITKATFKKEDRAEVIRLDTPIYVTRRVPELDNKIGVGDQISIDHYTATCQKVSEEGALFFMDQYDDDPQRMNDNENTNEGGYEKSDLRRRINNEESLKDFPEDIRSRLVPFENGDLIRIPTVCEMFGHEECEDWCEDDGAEQLPLMVSRANRVAYRKNECGWGWLQNKITDSATAFAIVYSDGLANNLSASGVCGVRRVFQISTGRK